MKARLKLWPRRFRRKILILVMVASIIPVFLPYGPRESLAQSSSNWLVHAEVAWGYFQPGFGLNATTGLHYGTRGWHHFSDWDLGCYILAILDAYALNLINWEGTWGAAYRLDKVLSFLKNRILNNGIPFWSYNADTGWPSEGAGPTNPSDSGMLLIALYKIKAGYPSLAQDVDYVVYSKTNYTALALQPIGGGFYGYLAAQGFKFFGFDNYEPVQYALMEMERLNSGEFVDIYGESIPVEHVTSEPILLGILNLNLNSLFKDFADRIYQVQKKRYEATGKFTAFSEGACPNTPWYLYEWIVQGSKDKLWVVADSLGNPLSRKPVVFTKVALGLHAIWPSDYTSEVVDYVLGDWSQNDFFEGVDEDGLLIAVMTDKTNSMIINAARYVIQGGVPAVGGVYIPVEKFELLAPYFGLATILAVAAATVVYAKKRKRKGD